MESKQTCVGSGIKVKSSKLKLSYGVSIRVKERRTSALIIASPALAKSPVLWSLERDPAKVTVVAFTSCVRIGKNGGFVDALLIRSTVATKRAHLPCNAVDRILGHVPTRRHWCIAYFSVTECGGPTVVQCSNEQVQRSRCPSRKTHVYVSRHALHEANGSLTLTTRVG